jgi:hypothetical protein
LAAASEALDIPLADLYEAADIAAPQTLPSIKVYMRMAYEWPNTAVDDLERYFQKIAQEYGLPSEPQDGEDELPEQ